MAYTYPGVYIEEVSSGVRPIESATTSTAAFIGQITQKVKQVDGVDVPVEPILPAAPTLIFSWADYVKWFGGIQDEGINPDPMGLAVYNFFLNGGGEAYIVRVVRVGTDSEAEAYVKAFASLEKIRDISIICLPGKAWGGTGAATNNAIIDSAVSHAEEMQNRMVIVDVAANVKLVDKNAATDLNLPSAPFSVTYYPWLEVANPFFAPGDEEPTIKLGDAENNVTTADAAVTTAEAGVADATGAQDIQAAKEALRKAQNDLKAAERVRASLLPPTFTIAPSSFAAGMWAKIDGRRGVWKAPAGVESSLLGVAGLADDVDDKLQGQLNPVGVNCIRRIPGAGPVIWGSRTLSTLSDPEWRYVPVRRTANMIEESIYTNIQWAVFEPNDHRLWSSLRVNIDAFMNGLWRAGAFQGESASDAYFVRCGLGATMKQDDIDAGRVIVEVGFAPLKPAEFVIVRIQQKVAQQ